MKRVTMMVLCLLLYASYAHAGQLPRFTLPDPQGTMHSSATLVKNGLVMFATAPTLHDESSQKGWDTYLVKEMPKTAAKLIFIEDMSSSLFKGEATSEMHKDWKAGDVPLLLIDKDGTVRKALGLGENASTVFVYDKTGNQVYSYSGAPSVAGAKTIWSKLK